MKTFKGYIAKVLLVLFVVATIFSFQLNHPKEKTETLFATRITKKEILVKYKDDAKSDSVKASVKGKLKLGKMDVKRKNKKHKMELIELGDSDNLAGVLKELQKDSNVEYAQPNYLVTINALPNDPSFNKEWGLSNNGQTVEGATARAGVDINVTSAWDITQGSSNVVVGVLDTGMDINHEDLKKNIFINSKEIPNNGKDDDGNGYIDDINGWNFADGTNKVYNSANPIEDEHGTAVAGILAAEANNSKGIAGVAPNVKLLPLKFINGNVGYTSDAIEAIDYAMAMGVKIINCSFVGSDNNPALKDAMQNSNILFVCSAGNTAADVSQYPTYPTGFGLSNILSVASVDGNGVLANFSSYGNGVDVAAPGVNILTTSPGGSYDYISGTSASTPFATGVAALVLSKNPSLTSSEIKSRIKNNVTKCVNLSGKISSGGRVDAKSALTNSAPANIDDYSGAGWENVTLSGGQLSGDADSWYTTNQLAKIKEQIHYGESGVNPATGNYSITVNDMSVSAPGFMVNISRTYNSKGDKSSVMGRGWTFGFTGNATGLNGDSDLVVVTLPTGAVERFTRNTNGSYSPSDSRCLFVANLDGTYTLTTKDQYSYVFDSSGKLTKMSDRNGNSVTIGFDTNGKIKSIADQADRTYTVNYNIDGLIDNVKDNAGGRTIKYLYTKPSNLSYFLLTQAVDPMGNNMYYSYDAQGYLTGISDHDKKQMVNLVYDHTSNNVSQATDQYGDNSVYTYDTLNSRTAISENNGARKWVYTYDDSFYTKKVQDPEGREVVTNYVTDSSGKNKFGDIQSSMDRYGNITIYDRDNMGNVTKTTNPDGSVNYCQFDSFNNLIMKEDENGKYTFYVYDAKGQTYNGKLLLLQIQPLDGTLGYKLVTGNDEAGKYAFSIYDNNNNLLLQVEPENGSIHYSANSDLNKFAITTYTYYTDAEAQQFGYKAKGLLRSEVDPEGNKTSYTYDQSGNRTSVTDARGKLTTTHYNAIGWADYVISPKQFRTDYTYDQNGQLEKTKLNNGETSRTVYNTSGRKIQEIMPNQYDASKDHTETGVDIYSDNSAGITYKYDLLYPNGTGLKITKTERVDSSTNYTTIDTFDVYGNLISEQRPDGSVYIYTYDDLDRQKSVSFKESAAAMPVLLEEYSYGIIGYGHNIYTQKNQVKYLNAAEKAVSVYTYDYNSRLVSQQNPDKTVSKTQYNANGTVYSTTDVKGKSAYYKYDGLNRLVEQWTPFEESSGEVLYTYTKTDYDKAGNKIAVKFGKEKVKCFATVAHYVSTNYTYVDGKLKAVTDSSGRKTEYIYDDDGNVEKEIVYTDPNDSNKKKVTDYTYNQQGKVLTKTIHVMAEDILGATTDKDLSTAYTYDKEGNVKTITTPNGDITTYTYDYLGRQTSASQPGIDEEGNPAIVSSATTYTSEGKIQTSTDALNHQTIYSYNKLGYLVSQKDAKGGVTSYFYDLAGRRIAEVSPRFYDSKIDLNNIATIKNINHVEYVYDVMGNLMQKVDCYLDENSNQWVNVVSKAYQYDESGNMIKEQDALGAQGNYGTEYTYNLANQQVTVRDPETQNRGLTYTTKYNYDALGRKISEINAKGVIINYYYNDAGKEIKVSVQKTASSPEQVMKSATYDLLGNPLTQTDGNGNTITFTYNAFGKLKSVTYPGDASIPSNTVIYKYDSVGNLVYQKDITNKVDLFTYDKQGRQLSHTQQMADGSQVITTSISYDLNGNQRFVTDGKGCVTENAYDELNRLEKTISDGHTTSYTYDANGNQLTATDWLGNASTKIYDALNRLIEKDDANGKAIQKLEYYKNSIQSISYDALGNKTQYIYDQNNRLICTIDPESHTNYQYYDDAGNISAKTDGCGNTTSYNYDEFNRLKSVVNAKSEVTSYTYDNNGNVTSLTDGNQNVTVSEYNVANKLVRKIYHGGRTGTPGSYAYDLKKVESFEYNADGTIAAQTDRNGKVTVYSYDIHGQLLSKSIGASVISYTYDKNGNQLTMTDGTGITIRDYDELNRVTSKAVPVIGKTLFEYDLKSVPGAEIPEGYYAEKTTDPKGNVTLKVYDKVGRLYSVTASGKTTKYGYYDNGSTAFVQYQSGAREEYTYDKDNLLATLVNKNNDGTVISTYSYTYDKNHNQITKQDEKGTTQYTYDSLNRMDSVTDPADVKTMYTFDKAGNRITEAVMNGKELQITIYKYDHLNRLLSTSVHKSGSTEKKSYQYDNNGNLISSTETVLKNAASDQSAKGRITRGGQNSTSYVTIFTYDVWNQLVKTTKGTNISLYVYNGEGLRVQKTVNGTVTHFLYEADQVILEEDGSGNQTGRNVYGMNLLERAEGDNTFYYMYNGHADVTALIDGTGALKATYYYDAFGNPDEDTKVNALKNVKNSITYAGYQYDSETGLYYLNARMYDSKIARFMQEDTYYGDEYDPLSLNLYTYCHNEPIMYTDPSGHIEKGDDKLSESQQLAILVLTQQYYGTTDKSQKTDIGKIANDIRSGKVDPLEIIGGRVNSSDISNVVRGLEENKNVSASDKKLIEKSALGIYNVNDTTSCAARDTIQKNTNEINSQLNDQWSRKDIPSLSKDSDFNLKPEVQQLISYYNDLNLYNETANYFGVYGSFINPSNQGLSEYKALKNEILKAIEKLRKKKSVDKETFLDGLGRQFVDLLGFVPYAGVLFDNPATAYAGTLSDMAMSQMSKTEVLDFIETAIASNIKIKHSIYTLVDPVTDEVKYVGRTRNQTARKAAHELDPEKGHLKFKPVEGWNDLSYKEARAAEQLLFEKHGGTANLLNKINPMSAKKFKKYVNYAIDVLKKLP